MSVCAPSAGGRKGQEEKVVMSEEEKIVEPLPVGRGELNNW